MPKLLSKITQGLCVAVTMLTATTSIHAEKITRPTIAKRNIYANSDILVSQHTHTVLPKNCVLYVPEHLKNRVAQGPKGIFLLWPQFYAKNYGWILKKEVSLAHATGEKTFTEKELEHFNQSGKIVIATHHRNPISVRKSITTISE